jgi:hypothetical protein
MPCRCCGAQDEPRGMQKNNCLEVARDNYINVLLKEVADEIKNNEKVMGYDASQWYNVWIEAFTHYLKGCPEEGDVA